MEVHTGISCPLGRFVRRNGAVAYSITVPPRYEAAVRAEGMVSGRNIGGYTEWIPREFSGSPFLDLLYQTDLAQGVEDLPENVSAAMLANVNRAIGRMPRSIESFEAVDGTYLNTDSLVPYRVFLVAGANRVDVSGVPLRYYWAEGADGSLVVFDVKVFSQQFSQRGISDLAGGQEPTHYDVIVFYQTAAVFRELNRANPARFAQFVTRACATR